MEIKYIGPIFNQFIKPNRRGRGFGTYFARQNSPVPINPTEHNTTTPFHPSLTLHKLIAQTTAVSLSLQFETAEPSPSLSTSQRIRVLRVLSAELKPEVKSTHRVGEDEYMELRGDGAQADQRLAFLCRQFHRTAGAQSHRCVSFPFVSLYPHMHAEFSTFDGKYEVRLFVGEK